MADQTSRNAAERRENALSDLTRNGMNFQNEKMKEISLYYFIIYVLILSFFIPQIWSETKIHFFQFGNLVRHESLFFTSGKSGENIAIIFSNFANLARMVPSVLVFSFSSDILVNWCNAPIFEIPRFQTTTFQTDGLKKKQLKHNKNKTKMNFQNEKMKNKTLLFYYFLEPGWRRNLQHVYLFGYCAEKC